MEVQGMWKLKKVRKSGRKSAAASASNRHVSWYEVLKSTFFISFSHPTLYPPHAFVFRFALTRHSPGNNILCKFVVLLPYTVFTRFIYFFFQHAFYTPSHPFFHSYCFNTLSSTFHVAAFNSRSGAFLNWPAIWRDKSFVRL